MPTLTTFNRDAVLKLLTEFSEGKHLYIDVPNPVWYKGNEDLLEFKLKPNFKLKEFTVSTLKRVGHGATKTNAPNIKIYYSLVNSLQNLKNRICKKYPDFSITIDSGHRTPWIDRSVGGSGSGPHTRGWATDNKFGGIAIPGRSADSIRRGVAYEAYKQGIKGIELIRDGVSVHFDPVRTDLWVVKQVSTPNGYAYPSINIDKELKAYALPGL